MIPDTFTAMIVEETAPKTFSRSIGSRTLDLLPEGSLVVRVHYSSLNYKDALSADGRPGVTRRYPHTPGIDAAGEVVECSDGRFAPGDRVIVTGHDLGMNTPGGYGQYIRVPSAWALLLPEGLTLKESMMLGTAGLTAGLSVLALVDRGITRDAGEILVTGATGGVGSLAVTILSHLGYQVAAVTGKMAEEAYLRSLGATWVIPREDLLAGADRPLMRERWAGVVDVVGGAVLEAAIKGTCYGGSVTCCGLVGSPNLSLTVFPFILRGVSLLGIDSAEYPPPRRREVWELLADTWKPPQLATLCQEYRLAELEERIMGMLSGGVRGRTVVNVLES